ncbi:MAG: WXG100 family type VII secretion target [Peptococcaceae bacterium]|nr:WXG100 family type VII secretion target [Peptococcaceae bacterium]
MSDDVIQIDTEQVSIAAANIKRLNQEIMDHFKSLDDAYESHIGNWKGQAAGNAKATFYHMRSYALERYKLINNMANFLKTQIGEGYDETEEENIDLADLFK